VREHGGTWENEDSAAAEATGARGTSREAATSSRGASRTVEKVVRSPVKARARYASSAARGELRGEALATCGDAPSEDRSADEYVLEFDGASRGNPGEAGAGALLRRKKDDRIVEELLEYLGSERTVNEAEYAALCLGLRKALELGITKIEVKGDSKLIVNQVDGSFKLKSENLRSMHAEACKLKEKFAEFKISHVKREFNKHADHLANMAVDFGLNPSRMTDKISKSGVESGGGGLGAEADMTKRRKTSGEARYSMLYPSLSGRCYHTVVRAESASEDARPTAGLAAVPMLVGSTSRSYLASNAARRAFVVRAAMMGFARLRL